MVEYQPGVCNIGSAERSKRRFVGYLGFLAAALVVIAVPLFGFDPFWLFASAVPFYAGFIGELQARSNFCAGFGIAGVYDVSDDGEERTAVPSTDARKRDRRKALILQLQAGGLSVVAASVVYAAGFAFASLVAG